MRRLGGVLMLMMVLACSNEAPPQPPTMVVVATRDLPAGSVIAAADLKAVPWAGQRPEYSARTTDGVVGLTVETPIATDSPVLATAVVLPPPAPPAPGSLPATLRRLRDSWQPGDR